MDNTHSNENSSTSEWRSREMGALWKKEGKSQKFYSGFFKINKGTESEKEFPVVIFLNKLKQKDNAPDLIIYESKDSSATLDHDAIPDSFID
jgi:hypothetical protein